MVTIDWGCFTHLVSKNKWVRVWHWRQGHASNTRIIKASKLLSSIGNFNAKYNLSEIYSDFKYKDSDIDSEQYLTTDMPLTNTSLLPETPNTNNIKLAQTNEDFDNICLPYIASKQSRAIIHKPMTEVEEKLEEIHVNLWGSHHPALLSEKKYVAILLNAKTRKTWIHYLQSKDEFVNIFQVWLPKVENEYTKSMKMYVQMEVVSLYR